MVAQFRAVEQGAKAGQSALNTTRSTLMLPTLTLQQNGWQSVIKQPFHQRLVLVDRKLDALLHIAQKPVMFARGNGLSATDTG